MIQGSARRRAATVRDKQDQVDLAATAAKPTDTFRCRFENIDKRLANVEKALPAQQPPRQSKPASGAAEPEQSLSEHDLTKTLLEKVTLLEKSMSDPRTSGSTSSTATPSFVPKNVSGPDATEVSKRALKRQRKAEAAEKAAKRLASNAQMTTQIAATSASLNSSPSNLTGGRGTIQRTHQQHNNTILETQATDMTQLELKCLNSTVHYVLNKEDSKDSLLTSNEVRQLLSKTPKFLPTPKCLHPKNVAKDCNLFGYRLIKTFNRFVCKDYISKAHANARAAGVVDWKPNQFPYSEDYYAEYTKGFFDVSKPSGTIWKLNQQACPRLQQFIKSFKTETTKKAVEIAKRGIRVKSNLSRQSVVSEHTGT